MSVVFNYGGGRQTVAICVLIARGLLPRPDMILIADTGRENQSTWEYLERYAGPYLATHGMQVEIAPPSLATVGLYDKHGRTLMPVYTSTGKTRAYCSGEWKRAVMDRHLRSKGITGGTKWLGLALEEKRRWINFHGRVDGKWTFHCPLVDMMINTAVCLNIIQAAGLPIPHHSSCWMCPHKSNAEWRYLRDNYPDLWKQAILMDEEVRETDPRGDSYLHFSSIPLAQADIDKDSGAAEPQQCTLGACFI